MRPGKAASVSFIICLCVVIVVSNAVTVNNIWGPFDFIGHMPDDVIAAAVLPLPISIHTEETEDDPPVRLRIPWSFTVFAEPNFQGAPVANFGSQYVTVIEEFDNGWALISTHYGEAWVYINYEMLAIDRFKGLFANKDDSYYTSIIEPQVVKVLYRDDNWIQIDAASGPMWVDLAFQPPVSVLQEYMAQFGGRISVFYENFESGFVFVYNGDRVFFGASAIKAPYALWVYLQAEAGYADLSTVHTFTSADMWGGSGIIQNMPVGSTFTESELLGLALSVSDNIAFRMLVRRIHGVNGFRDYVEQIGGNPALVHTVTYSHMTANDSGLFAREMHRYIESGGRYSAQFRQQLLDNRYPFVVSDHPVASKSGWAVGGFHDIAIVYSPSPYSLVLMSEGTGGYSDRRAFRQISMKIQQFNDKYFAGLY